MSQEQTTLKERARELSSALKKAQIPFFCSIYFPEDRKYFNSCFLPEEVSDPDKDITEQNGKFKSYLRACLDVCPEDYILHIG